MGSVTHLLSETNDNQTAQVSSNPIQIPADMYVEDDMDLNAEVVSQEIPPLADHSYKMLNHEKISTKNLEIISELDVRKILTIADHFKASDVLISSGQPVLVRCYGKLYALTYKNLKGIEINNFLSIINGAEALSSIRRGVGLNFAYSCSMFDPEADLVLSGFVTTNSISGDTNVLAVDRNKVVFRCNVSACMDNAGNTSFQIVMRLIPSNPPKYSDIGLDLAFIKKSIPHIGIIYMAGQTGSGKSTTLASIIRYILEEETHIQGNIITIEEPIEFRYHEIKSKHSVIIQSQVPEHFGTFALAVREAMRRKPALILVAELRDPESFGAAIELSQTGHPVLSTVHSNDVSGVIPRILELVPKEQQNRKLTESISTAHAFIAQRLIETPNGKQLAVRENLFFNKSLRTKLLDIAISDAGYAGVVREIRSIMDNNPDGTDISSPNFETQGNRLLAAGEISQAGYQALLAG